MTTIQRRLELQAFRLDWETRAIVRSKKNSSEWIRSAIFAAIELEAQQKTAYNMSSKRFLNYLTYQSFSKLWSARKEDLTGFNDPIKETYYVYVASYKPV